MWRWQKSTEKCQLIDMLQFKKVIFVYKYNIVVKSMKVTKKSFLLVMHCEAMAEKANKRCGAGNDDAVFVVEFQCCGPDEVVRWGRNKKNSPIRSLPIGEKYVDKYGYIILLKFPLICSIRIRNHLQSICQNPETAA